MDTSKILSFRHPSQGDLLLEAFLISSGRIPEQVRKVSVRSDLPSVLQRIAIQAAKRKCQWGAWTRDGYIWFFIAEVVAAPTNHSRRPALKVNGFDARGKLVECGVWVNMLKGGWRRCAL